MIEVVIQLYELFPKWECNGWPRQEATQRQLEQAGAKGKKLKD